MRKARLKRDSDDSSQKSVDHSEGSRVKSAIARPISIKTSDTMKKLAPQQHPKQPARCTNLVHIKQVDRNDCASGSLIRTYQKHDRSSESLLRSSESGEEELAKSNLSNECVAATSSVPAEVKRAIRPSFSSDAQKEPVQIQSESSLTLSLPRDITTSWLERERELFRESDSDVKTLSYHRPSVGEPGSRATAKSIFSTNKSLVLETTRNSIQIVPDVTASDALCRPPEFPADATLETSDFEDLHQFESLDASCPSNSDREFRSVPSKAGGTRDTELVPDAGGTKESFSRGQADFACATLATAVLRHPSSEEPTVSERTKECSCQHPVTLDLTSTVVDATLPRPAGRPCSESVTDSVVTDKAIQDVPSQRQRWSQDMLTVSPSMSGPLQNLASVEADILATVRDNIMWKTAHNSGLTLKTSERSSVIEPPVPRRKSVADSSVDDDESAGALEGALDNSDASSKPSRTPVDDVGTNAAAAVRSVSPKSAYNFQKLNGRKNLSKPQVESTPDDIRDCGRSSCTSRVWTCPEDLLLDDVGAVAGVPDFAYFDVDPTRGFPRRSSVASENAAIGEKSAPGILSPSVLAALRAQHAGDEHLTTKKTSAELVLAQSSATNCSSFTTVPTIVQTEPQAAKPNPSIFSETSDTFKTTEEKNPSDHALPHAELGEARVDLRAEELESQSNDFSVEVPAEETFRHERILTESDSRGFQPSFTTELCHREKELSSVAETSASTLEEERANVDVSVKHSGDFSLSQEEVPVASSKSRSSSPLQQGELPPVFSFSAEDRFDTASSEHTKEDDSAEEGSLLSDFPESLPERLSGSEFSEERMDGGLDGKNLTTAFARPKEQRSRSRHALVAFWRHRRTAAVPEAFLGSHLSISDSPPVINTTVVPLYSSAVAIRESPFGRLFAPEDMPTCAQDACENVDDGDAIDDSPGVLETQVSTRLANTPDVLQDLRLGRLVGKNEPRTSPSRASDSVLETRCERLDAAAPVLAISFAVLALVAAAAILLQKEPSGPEL